MTREFFVRQKPVFLHHCVYKGEDVTGKQMASFNGVLTLNGSAKNCTFPLPRASHSTH